MNNALLPGLAVAAALVSFSTCRPVARRAPGQQQSLCVGALAGVVTSALLGLLGASIPLALAGGAVAGVFSGDRARRGERRRQGRDRMAIERALPDALDLLAGLVEAGAPLAAALAAVAERVDEPLRRELEACTSALSASGSRRAAFGLLRRSGSPDLARGSARPSRSPTSSAPGSPSSFGVRRSCSATCVARAPVSRRGPRLRRSRS